VPSAEGNCSAASGGGAAAARKIGHPLRMHSTYFELYRMRTDRHWLHQKLVTSARARGVKAAAREFGCSRNTVRKWLRRFQPGKPSALVEHSRRPKRSPNQISRVCHALCWGSLFDVSIFLWLLYDEYVKSWG